MVSWFGSSVGVEEALSNQRDREDERKLVARHLQAMHGRVRFLSSLSVAAPESLSSALLLSFVFVCVCVCLFVCLLACLFVCFFLFGRGGVRLVVGCLIVWPY